MKDRRLLDCLIDVCVNESVLNTNRYKFSASAEFFVPNKTLYKDYLEFLKTLPGDSDNDVIDLDPTCSMVKHLDNGLGFLRSLAKTNQSLEDSSPTASDVTDAGLSANSFFSKLRKKLNWSRFRTQLFFIELAWCHSRGLNLTLYVAIGTTEMHGHRKVCG